MKVWFKFLIYLFHFRSSHVHFSLQGAIKPFQVCVVIWATDTGVSVWSFDPIGEVGAKLRSIIALNHGEGEECFSLSSFQEVNCVSGV